MDPSMGRARGRANGRPPLSPNTPESTGPHNSNNIRSLPELIGAIARTTLGECHERSPAIEEFESSRGAMRGRRLLADIVRTRPDHVTSKKGFTGQITTLRANYFKISKSDNWSLHKYRVDFAPDVDVTIIRKALLKPHKKLFDGYLFDGTMLFTCTKMETKILETVKNDGSNIKITVSYTSSVSMNEQSSIQVLNLILRRSMEGLKLQLVGRNYFDPVAKIPITDFRLELWPGYITSIRQHEYDILLCAEISTKVMRMETLHDILQDCIQNFKDYRDVFMKTVIGTTVLTDYSNKTYLIDDIDWDHNPTSSFNTKDGPVRYVDYYRNRYNINIKDQRQPLILSRSKERQKRAGKNEIISLIPELCRATGLTDTMRSNFRLMKAVADYTRIGPGQRVRRLLDFNQRLSHSPESMQILRDWKMSLDSQLVELNGRELPEEKIVFLQKEVPASKEADWTREFRNTRFYTTTPLTHWHLIVPKRAQREAREFIRVLQDSVRNMGLQINPPKTFVLENDRVEETVMALENCGREDTQLIMVVVSNNNSARYGAIKKKCCVDRAIPTQVIMHKTITPKNGNFRSLMSVATKVAIQLNCKIGAAPWSIHIPLTGLMTVGFDVSHDTKNRSISYGALIATMDLRNSCKYFSSVSSHRNGEEMTNELVLNMTKALKEYRQEHGNLPSKIIFYRDGVSESQTHYLLEVEVKHLQQSLEKHYQTAGQELRFTFIIVNKKINTRIFKLDKNPQPGTVVDDVITLPERYDFFLVSQSVRQGTASPTSYSVIYDTLQLPPDKLQMLTYKMCHLYYNWSGTTRVPAVCQYAHKLSFLVSEHIHQPPSQMLQKQLYFL